MGRFLHHHATQLFDIDQGDGSAVVAGHVGPMPMAWAIFFPAKPVFEDGLN